MVRVSLDLRGPSFMTFNQHANGVARKGHRRGIKVVPPRCQSIRLLT